MVAHIFLSYKREEMKYARRVRDALRSVGYEVFWDQDVQLGQRWNEALDVALTTAQYVVVLWSHRSTRSEWVKHEASIALARGVLRQLKLEDGISVPAQYRREQMADLTAWDGRINHEGFRRLLDSLATPTNDSDDSLRGDDAPPWPRTISRPPRVPGPWSAVAATLVGAAATAVIAYALWPESASVDPRMVDACELPLTRLRTASQIPDAPKLQANAAQQVVDPCLTLVRALP